MSGAYTPMELKTIEIITIKLIQFGGMALFVPPLNYVEVAALLNPF